LSYFVGLDADETIPQTILAGDRNLVGKTIVNDLLVLDAKTRLSTRSPEMRLLLPGVR
jgi:hypothetical protein